jgi:hypothetical protein
MVLFSGTRNALIPIEESNVSEPPGFEVAEDLWDGPAHKTYQINMCTKKVAAQLACA